MKSLRVVINFRDSSSQTLQRNVSAGEGVDLSVLHQNILTLQKETNDILTREVENDKRAVTTTVKISNSNGSNTDDEEDEDDEEDNEAPPEKLQKR